MNAQLRDSWRIADAQPPILDSPLAAPQHVGSWAPPPSLHQSQHLLELLCPGPL
jgi:hypothetical protein